MGSALRTLVAVSVIATLLPAAASAQPAGFLDSLYAGGLASPTAMAFAPDGRLFVCEQTGALRVIKNGILQTNPFVTIPVISTNERGLLGIAFDPNFAVNQYVYVYYSSSSSGFNRISRFTANGDVAAAGSEVVIFELDETPAPTNHNGGAIHFGADGKLYAAIGDYAVASNSQTLTNLAGKMLRINADGSIPADNPFFGVTTGKRRAIWAYGLRNPFTFGVSRSDGRIFINDVGAASFEEINDGVAGSNYGWPNSEGYTTDPGVRSPLYAYARGGGVSNCAIVGGAFYDPVTVRFPGEYVGDYFFADLCSGRISRFDLGTGAVTEFSFGGLQIVDIKTSADGYLYYLSRGSGAVFRVDHVSSTGARFAIGLGPFSGDGGRASIMKGAEGGFGPAGNVQAPWQAYAQNGGGVHAASGDVDGDGLDELVLGLAVGGSGWMAVLDDAEHGHALLSWVRLPWPAYNANNGAVFPAVGNIDDDPAAEIVAGLGNGGMGWFAIFDDSASEFSLIGWRQIPWPQYNDANGTTHPAIGDVDGDGRGEIVLGLGTGGGGWLAVVEGASSSYAHRQWLRVHWESYNTANGETWPAAGDLDGDGKAELAVGFGQGGGGYVEIIDDLGTGFVNAAWIRLSWDSYNVAIGETHPAIGNLDGDARLEIVVGHGRTANEGGWVEIFDDGWWTYRTLGWRGTDWTPARPAGAATFPAAGRMR